MAATYDNLVQLGEDSCRRFAERPLLGEKRDGQWVWTSYGGFQGLVDDFRAGLAGLGVEPGDRVAIVSRNSLAWAVAAYATYGLQATFVPMYEAQLPDEWRFILADSGATVVLGSNEHVVAALDEMRPTLPELRHVISVQGSIEDPRSYASLIAYGHAHPSPSRTPAADSIAGFVYTSGTTGKPKGAMLSHRNLASNVIAALEAFPIEPDDRTLSFLPWAHVYGQVVELHILVAAGASTAINTLARRAGRRARRDPADDPGRGPAHLQPHPRRRPRADRRARAGDPASVPRRPRRRGPARPRRAPRPARAHQPAGSPTT